MKKRKRKAYVIPKLIEDSEGEDEYGNESGGEGERGGRLHRGEKKNYGRE